MATARQTLMLLAALGGAIAGSQAPEFAQQGELYRSGALFVSRSWLPTGCADWLRA